MSGTFGSTVDEFGSGGNIKGFRQMTDIADDKGSYYLMKEGISEVIRRTGIIQDKDLILRAGQNVTFRGNPEPWVFTGTDDVMVSTYPLKSGDINDFSDNTTSTLVNTNTAHGLQENDLVTIMDSRISEYNGIYNVDSVPTTTSFEIGVIFDTADGEARFTQKALYVTSMSESAVSGTITDLTLVDGGTNYVDTETVTINGLTSGKSTATATVSVNDGVITSVVLVDGTSGYTDGETATLTGASSSDATVTITANPDLITLTATSHGLDDDISVNLANTSNGFDGTYVIRNSTTDNFDIPATFSSTGTGYIEVGHGIIIFKDELFINGSYPTWNTFMDLEPIVSSTAGGLLIDSCNFVLFEVGEARNNSAIAFSNQSGFTDCGSFTSAGNTVVGINNFGVINSITPFESQLYQPSVRIVNGSPISFQNNITGFTMSEYQSFLEAQTQIDDNASLQINNGGGITPAAYFSTGFISRTTASAITSADGGNSITIPVDETIRHREGDTIEILDSTSYVQGVTGTIDSGGIIKDTSIQVSIPYVAGDTEILLRNNSLASIDQTDSRVICASNIGIPNSVTTGQFIFENINSPLTVSISSSDTPVAIGGGNWIASNLTRVTADGSDNGIATINSTGTHQFTIEYSALIEKAGGGRVDIGITLLINGVEGALNPPHSVDRNPMQISRTETFELSEGDTVQIAVVNYRNAQNIDVSQAQMTIVGGA